jgi:hypothetical protein
VAVVVVDNGCRSTHIDFSIHLVHIAIAPWCHRRTGLTLLRRLGIGVVSSFDTVRSSHPARGRKDSVSTGPIDNCACCDDATI